MLFFKRPCEILLTGALCGRVRATLDLDFALTIKARSSQEKDMRWQEFGEAAKKTTALTGIQVQYAEDIDGRPSIAFPDYEKQTRFFKRFGKVEVRLLDPAYWAIGKLARYLDPDIRDLIQVLKKTKTSWKKLARLLGLALRKSPKSTACFLFRRQVEDFLTIYGRQVWGKTYSKEQAIRIFHQSARIQP